MICEVLPMTMDCSECGGTMRFDPKARVYRCPKCSHEYDVYHGNQTTMTNDIRTELENLLADCGVDAEHVDRDFLYVVASHFAEWQKQQDDLLIKQAKVYYRLLGKSQMKEQMMKEAAEKHKAKED